MAHAKLPAGRVWELPPVILHPFSDPSGPDQLVESSRAHLMLEGILPMGEYTEDELLRRLLSGRLTEVKMLFYVGRDLERWLGQCMETASRDPDLSAAGLAQASFAHLLVEHPPEKVRAKLARWGVSDYRSIFSRALGLNAVFAEPPEFDMVTPGFIRHYYRYADQMWVARQGAAAFPTLPPDQFRFELYASAEYTKMLEEQWEDS
ncbi:MAG: hypothetical protein N2036_07180 [Bryobacteraceae bacterium]|nr:hypothetical protein [Bryobacteraceae bacterium]MCX7603841.1 hypothetical protein [Bryobacteraceae bacterium]